MARVLKWLRSIFVARSDRAERDRHSGLNRRTGVYEKGVMRARGWPR